jgi:hypothetical protein
MERLDDPGDQTRQQQMRGCHGPAIAPFNHDGEELARCPVRVVDWAAAGPVLEAWPLLRSGRYPLAGGYADQPALFVDLLAEAERFEAEQPK